MLPVLIRCAHIAFGTVAVCIFLFELSAGTAAAQDALSRAQTFELQFRLNQLGFDAGRPDGRPGQQTRSAAAKFARTVGAPPEMSPALLARAREVARSVEGLKRRDGTVDLLLFTDEGSPLILNVETWGIVRKSASRDIDRGRDRDGSDLEGSRFSVSDMARVLDVPNVPNISFGYRLHVPTPPRGERFQFEHVIFKPEKLPDGSTKTHRYEYRWAFLRRPEFDPWYVYAGTGKDPDPRFDGTWKVDLTHNGEVLMSRGFAVRTP